MPKTRTTTTSQRFKGSKMPVNNSQEKVKSGQDRQISSKSCLTRLPVGCDIGNGSVKLVLGSNQIRIASYILPFDGEVYDHPKSGYVEYLDGERTDLAGKRWFAGVPAYEKSPKGYIRIVSNVRNKVEYGLQALLGALSELPPATEWSLAIAASIQDAQTYRDELRNALEGFHQVQFNGSKTPSSVNIKVLRVFEEGAGVIAECMGQLQPGRTVLFDFGSGTSIVSMFAESCALMERKVFDVGVDALIEAIANNTATRKELGKAGDMQLIQQGIEDGSFAYGFTDWNFKSVYEAELKPWALSTLSKTLRAAESWIESSRNIIATGGGSQMPIIEQVLSAKRIRVMPNGLWNNAAGLAKLATKLNGGLS